MSYVQQDSADLKSFALNAIRRESGDQEKASSTAKSSAVVTRLASGAWRAPSAGTATVQRLALYQPSRPSTRKSFDCATPAESGRAMGSPETKAIRLPSGDQRNPSTPLGALVSWSGSPPRGDTR